MIFVEPRSPGSGKLERDQPNVVPPRSTEGCQASQQLHRVSHCEALVP